jgi:hypothetical protein
MKLALIALSVLCLCASGADKKKKPPDVQVVELKVRKDGSRVTVDGRVRATGLKPLRGLILSFDFIASGNAVMTTKQAPIDEEVLNPGDEAAIHAETEYPARSIEYRVRAYQQGDKELVVANPGPYPILN